MKTTINSIALGRPASYIPFGNVGNKVTINQLMARLAKLNRPMTRVAVTQRVNAEVSAGRLTVVDKIIAGRGRPLQVFKIVKATPNAASFKRVAKKVVVKAKAKAAKKSVETAAVAA